MAPIAPDQDEDNQFFNVLTEPQDSESSGEEQIPMNQSVATGSAYSFRD